MKKITDIPCDYPYCSCREPKVYWGAREIAPRLGVTSREAQRWKGNPVERRSGRLFARECAIRAWLSGII
jgi:hypothetical protein